MHGYWRLCAGIGYQESALGRNRAETGTAEMPAGREGEVCFGCTFVFRCMLRVLP